MKLGFAYKYFDAQAKQPFPFKITTRTRFLSLDREEQACLLASWQPTTSKTKFLRCNS